MLWIFFEALFGVIFLVLGSWILYLETLVILYTKELMYLNSKIASGIISIGLGVALLILMIRSW